MDNQEPIPQPLNATVLVVDDAPINLHTLRDLLSPLGVRVRGVTDGESAIALAHRFPPDLVLLDIGMPNVDGFEVCARLRATPGLAEIPIMFVSGRDDVDDKVRGLELGAIDYITKPFDPSEVRARVAVHLARRMQALWLKTRLEEVVSLEAARDDLVHMVVHDLRTPLSVASTCVELLAPEIGGSVGPESLEDWGCLADAIRQLSTMVEAILDAQQIETAGFTLQPESTRLLSMAEGVVHRLGVCAGTVQRTLELSGASDPGELVCDPGLVERILTNLVDNALKYAPRGSTVEVAVRDWRGGVRVEVTDSGRPIPEQQRRAIFERFRRLGIHQGDRRGVGLGLAFCRLAVEAHGGSIGVATPDSGGNTFWFWLPARPAVQAPGSLAS